MVRPILTITRKGIVTSPRTNNYLSQPRLEEEED